jgi:thioredoxin reductase
MQGFLSRDGMPAAELLALGREEVRRYGVGVIEDRVETIELGFTVRLASDRVLAARRILLATGARDQLPDIPGVRERWGRDLLHCPYCHGWEVRDQALGVLGTTPDAAEHALLVRQWSDDVVFFADTSSPALEQLARLSARGVTVVPGVVSELVVEHDRLTGVRMADGTVIERDAVFIRPVSIPADGGLAASLGCALDAHGFPVVDGAGRTSVAGVWAAGNAADPRLQVIASAGVGAMVAMTINADLVQET